MSDFEVVTPLGTNLPGGWELKQLGTMCSKIGSGATPRGGSAVYTESGTAFIRSQNVFDHFFSRAGLAFIDNMEARRLSNVLVEPRDVLLNITGDGDTIARCCTAPANVLPARVNQHVMIIRPRDGLVPEYLQRYLSHPRIREYMLNHNSGGSRRALTKGHVEKFMIVVPPALEQLKIADLLGILDEKIAMNERIARAARLLGASLFDAACAIDSKPTSVGSLSSMVMRGGTPTYTEDPINVTVVNQRCIRNGRIDLGPSRRTLTAKIRAGRFLRNGDVLVNSTGVGTLGRAAIWIGDASATCDSHVTIVRPDSARVNSLVCGYAILAAQSEIEQLGEGSTGQTELSRHKLAQVEVSIPARNLGVALEAQLSALEQRREIAFAENRVLGDLRDALLPKLISGELRIADAGRLVSSAV